MGHNFVSCIRERLEIASQQNVSGRRQAVVRPTNRLRELVRNFLKELGAVVNTNPLALCFDQDAFSRIPNAGGRDVAVVGGQVNGEAFLLKPKEQLLQMALQKPTDALG